MRKPLAALVSMILLVLGVSSWGIEPRRPTSPQVEALISAIRKGEMAKVEKLVQANPRLVNMESRFGLTPLHVASRFGQLEIAKLLIAKGADVNARPSHPLGNKCGSTPLHSAAAGKSKAVVELLIAKGADVNAKDECGWTPLFCAASTGSAEVAEVLIANGADVNARCPKYNVTPLHVAAVSGNREVARLLIAKGADVNVRTTGRVPIKLALPAGTTPLKAAVIGGSAEIVQMLRSKGATE